MKISVALSGNVGSEVRSFIEKEVSKLLRSCPKMKSWFGGITYIPGVTNEFDTFSKEIRISSYVLNGTLKQADIAIDKANKKGFLVGYGLRSLIHHEFGHAVNMFIVDNMDEEGKDDWFEAKRKLLRKLPHRSEYSRKNDREQFAEQYAYEQYTRKGELLSLIQKFLKRV